MSGILLKTIESSGPDTQKRVRYDLDTLHALERETTLGQLYRYWLSRQRRPDALPSVSEFRPQDYLPRASSRTVSWIDAKVGDPFGFVLHNHVVHTYGDFSGKTLASHPRRMLADACAFEYMVCKKLAQPMYHEIDQTIGGIHRNYARLLLPLVDDTGEVSAIYYTFRFLRPPERAISTGAGVTQS